MNKTYGFTTEFQNRRKWPLIDLIFLFCFERSIVFNNLWHSIFQYLEIHHCLTPTFCKQFLDKTVLKMWNFLILQKRKVTGKVELNAAWKKVLREQNILGILTHGILGIIKMLLLNLGTNSFHYNWIQRDHLS